MKKAALTFAVVIAACLPTGHATPSEGGDDGETLDRQALSDELTAIRRGTPSQATKDARDAMSVGLLTHGVVVRWDRTAEEALADEVFVNALRVAAGGETFGSCSSASATADETSTCAADAGLACGNGTCCSPFERFACPDGCHATVSEAESACPGACVACGAPNDDNIGPTSIAPRSLTPLDVTTPGCVVPGGAERVFFTATEAWKTVVTDGAWTCSDAMDAQSRAWCFAAIARAMALGLKLAPKPHPVGEVGPTDSYLACRSPSPSKPPSASPSSSSSSSGSDSCGATGSWTLTCPVTAITSGPCDGLQPFSTYFDISASIAAKGGSWTEDHGVPFQVTFDPKSCSVLANVEGTVCPGISGTFQLKTGTGKLPAYCGGNCNTIVDCTVKKGN